MRLPAARLVAMTLVAAGLVAATGTQKVAALESRAVPRGAKAPLLSAYSTCAAAVSREAETTAAARESVPLMTADEEDAFASARVFNSSIFDMRDFNYATSVGPFAVSRLTKAARSPKFAGLTMDIFFPRDFPTGRCLPSIGLLHHASEYEATADNEWGAHCRKVRYIYIYMCVCVCVYRSRGERIRGTLINIHTHEWVTRMNVYVSVREGESESRRRRY